MVQTGKNRMLTTSGVARMLHLHVNTVRRWSNQGLLRSYRIGPRGDRRFVRQDIMVFLNQDNGGMLAANDSTSKEDGDATGPGYSSSVNTRRISSHV